jgi:predicted TPR repeat methyltransferase
VAADVFVYFGALSEALSAVHSCLEPGGWFVFSVEELLPDHEGNVHGNGDWALERMGRYAHSMSYVADAIQDAGFVVRALERQVVRYEVDAPVAGVFAVLERAQA